MKSISLTQGKIALVDDISEDCSGEKVGIYTLNKIATFKVQRSLK